MRWKKQAAIWSPILGVCLFVPTQNFATNLRTDRATGCATDQVTSAEATVYSPQFDLFDIDESGAFAFNDIDNIPLESAAAVSTYCDRPSLHVFPDENQVMSHSAGGDLLSVSSDGDFIVSGPIGAAAESDWGGIMASDANLDFVIEPQTREGSGHELFAMADMSVFGLEYTVDAESEFLQTGAVSAYLDWQPGDAGEEDKSSTPAVEGGDGDTAADDGDGSAPINAEYDNQENLLVGMNLYSSPDADVSISYGSRGNSIKPWNVQSDDPYEQLALNVDVPLLSVGRAYARTEQAKSAEWQSPAQATEDDWGLLQYGLSAQFGSFEVGSSYDKVGADYDPFLYKEGRSPQRDTESSTFYSKWTQGRLSVKGSYGTSRRNLNPRGNQAQYEDTLAGVSADVQLLSWPYLSSSVWYRDGDRETFSTPNLGDRYAGGIQTVGGSLYLETGWGSQSLSTNIMDTDDSVRSGRGMKGVSYDYYLEAYPAKNLSMAVGLSASSDDFSDIGYRWSGKSLGQSAWMKYRVPRKPYSIGWSGYIDAYDTLDNYTNYSWKNADVYIQFDRVPTLGGRLPFEVELPLTISLGYSDYQDRIYPQFDSDDVTLWLQIGRQIPHLGPRLHSSSVLGR